MLGLKDAGPTRLACSNGSRYSKAGEGGPRLSKRFCRPNGPRSHSFPVMRYVEVVSVAVVTCCAVAAVLPVPRSWSDVSRGTVVIPLATGFTTTSSEVSAGVQRRRSCSSGRR